MLRLKRTKGNATHCATAVSPAGTVEGWSGDPAQAVAITEGVAKRVRERYAGKKNVGEFAFESVDASGMQLATAVTTGDEVGAAELVKLQAECKRLSAENAELRQANDQGQLDLAEARSHGERLSDKARPLEAELVASGERAAELTARVAELEALLASATEPSKPVEPAHETKHGRKAGN